MDQLSRLLAMAQSMTGQGGAPAQVCLEHEILPHYEPVMRENKTDQINPNDNGR